MSRRPAEARTFTSWAELRAYVEELTDDIYRQDVTDALTMTPPAGMELDRDELDTRIVEAKALTAAQIDTLLTQLGAPHAKAQ